MVGRVCRTAGLIAFLGLAMSGCFSCSSSDDDGISINVDDDGISGGMPLFNGLTCETADSSWRCEAEDGTSLDFAIYFFTFRGIAVMTSPQETASQETFTWVQPTATRVEITTDDDETLIADDIDGSVAERFLTFVLSGGDEPTRSFDCTLDDENVLDADCDERVDGLPTPAPVTFTSTPTATATPS